MKEFSNLDAPPLIPFYEERPKRRHKGHSFAPVTQGYKDRKARELAEELAKPIKARVGKLRSLTAGDFTPEEVARLQQKYGRR